MTRFDCGYGPLNLSLLSGVCCRDSLIESKETSTVLFPWIKGQCQVRAWVLTAFKEGGSVRAVHFCRICWSKWETIHYIFISVRLKGFFLCLWSDTSQYQLTVSWNYLCAVSSKNVTPKLFSCIYFKVICKSPLNTLQSFSICGIDVIIKHQFQMSVL